MTDGRTRLAGGAVRGAPDPSAGGGLPDARLAERGGRRRPGSLAPAQPRRRQRRREPRRMADDGRRPGVPGHAALAPVAARGAAGRGGARARPWAARKRRDPEQEVLLADSVGLALLVVLETLAPAERVAFVLHDMFDLPFDEIAADRGALRRPRPASWPAARAAACRERPPTPTPIWPGSGKWSTPSWPPRAAATSTRWSPCSTPRWCCGPTPRRCGPGRRARFTARPRWPAPSPAGPVPCGRRS